MSIPEVFQKYDFNLITNKDIYNRDGPESEQFLGGVGGRRDNIYSQLPYYAPPDKRDTDLKYLKKIRDVDPFRNIFGKPRLDNKWIDYVQDKLEKKQEIDYDNFVLETIGVDEQKKLHYIMKHFPEVIEKKLIAPLTKIELHTKALKIMTLGVRTGEDYILLYLIRGKKIELDIELIEKMLIGLQNKPNDNRHTLNGNIVQRKSFGQKQTDLPQNMHRFVDKYKNLEFRHENINNHWNRRFEPDNNLLDTGNMKTFDNIGNYQKNSLFSLQ